MVSLSTLLNERDETSEGPGTVARAAVATTGALRLLKDAAAPERDALPTLATPGDVREVVRYLKKKPAGVSVVEALNDSKRRAFESRKVAAYESWGLIERRGARVLLTAFGQEFARKLAPEVEAYRDLLAADAVYRSALEWIHRQQAELVTHSDLAPHLSELLGARGDAEGGKVLLGGIVCFFHLCQAAELGTVTIGKRGQPARLRVEREELAAWVARGHRPALASIKHADGDEPPPAETPSRDAGACAEPEAGTPTVRPAGASALRLYISCGAPASGLLVELRSTLELLDVESHVCERGVEPAAAVPIADAAAELMRGCDAALLVITREDREEEDGLKRGVLIEAGAAYVLYAGRVLILHEEGLELPGSLGDLPRFAFRGDALTWETGLELLRAIKGLRPARQRAAP